MSVLEKFRPCKSAGGLPIDEEANKHDILRIYIYIYIYIYKEREIEREDRGVCMCVGFRKIHEKYHHVGRGDIYKG